MTKIIHEFLNDSISKHSNTNDFLLSNKKGGFFVDNNTIYRGLYFYENEILKTVESIKLGAVKELKNKFYCFERKYSKAKDRLFFDDCFLYEVWDYKGKVKVSLDFRRIHDFRKKSKYKIYDEDNFIIVESENNFLVIKTDAEYEKLFKYRIKEYGAFSKEVYDAFNFKIKEKAKIVFSFSKDKKRAMKKAFDMFLNSDKKLRNAEIRFNEMIDPAFENIDKKIKFAYLSAVKSLDNLIINNSIYSGFPSKLQIWTRDELMSLKALMFLNQNDLIKDIILSYLSSIKDDGLLPRYFGAEEDSLESTAWLFLRLRDFVKHLTNVGLVSIKIDDNEFRLIKEKLENLYQKIIDTYISKYFLINKPYETWMDSLSREGFRIEFQALNLAIMETIIFLNDFMNENNKLKYMSWGVEDISELRVKDYFFVRDNLLDGLEDENIRPNAFLAYYIHNDFLNGQEWTKVFENALKKLWIDFGLASVDKKSKLFKDNALHNSKSFFFMNNISAISMKILDKDKFSKYIKDISESSAEEILFSGCIGSCSEFSSYSKLTSEGSIVNSLSAATFIELVNEIHQATF